MTKAILARAKRKILLADSTKWERPSIIRFANGVNSTIGSPTNRHRQAGKKAQNVRFESARCAWLKRD